MIPPEVLTRRDIPAMACLAARLFVDHPLVTRFLGADAEETLRRLYVEMLRLTLADSQSRSIVLGARAEDRLSSLVVAQQSSWQPGVLPFVVRMLSLAVSNPPARLWQIARFLTAFDEMRLKHPGAADELEISLLGCDPAFQRRGLGSDLMAAIVLHAQREEYRQIRLEVAAESPAVQFYERHGFAIAHTMAVAGTELHIMRRGIGSDQSSTGRGI